MPFAEAVTPHAPNAVFAESRFRMTRAHHAPCPRAGAPVVEALDTASERTLRIDQPESAAPITVLIADSQPMIVEGLRNTIGGDLGLRCVGDVEDGTQAVEAFRLLRPTVVLLDLLLPTQDGFEATAQIRTIDPSARIVVFTRLDGEDDVRRAVQAGVSGYLPKTASASGVIACLRSVASGRTCYAPEIGRRLASWVANDALSDRELQILRLVAEGHCNKMIARAKHITEGTTKSHLKQIFRKLGVSSRTAAVHTAIKRGVVRVA